MQENDIPQVLKIEQLGYSHPWTEGIFRACLNVGYRAFVIEKDEHIVGYGLTSIVIDECHILNVCIDPAEQHKGYAGYLLNFLLEDAEQNLATMVYLEVRVSNFTAIRLYQRLGFEEIGTRKNYYPVEGGFEDARIFRLSLKGPF